MVAIIDLQHTHTTDSIHSSLFVLPQKTWVDVGILLLSCIRCIQAEINVISYLLLVFNRRIGSGGCYTGSDFAIL